jgi:hypothetical protein
LDPSFQNSRKLDWRLWKRRSHLFEIGKINQRAVCKVYRKDSQTIGWRKWVSPTCRFVGWSSRCNNLWWHFWQTPPGEVTCTVKVIPPKCTPPPPPVNRVTSIFIVRWKIWSKNYNMLQIC